MNHQISTRCLNNDDYLPSVIKGMMGRMEFVMGGRMHSLMLATGILTPVLGICFEQKIRSFGEVIGQEEYFVEADGLFEVDYLLSVIDLLWSNREKIRRTLESNMKRLRQTAESNVLLLGNLLKISGIKIPKDFLPEAS
ncbi:MAG: polysaccharide pyruvyl transferase family protein, partial [Candidatus Hodarchaeota archaeon]